MTDPHPCHYTLAALLRLYGDRPEACPRHLRPQLRLALEAADLARQHRDVRTLETARRMRDPFPIIH